LGTSITASKCGALPPYLEKSSNLGGYVARALGEQRFSRLCVNQGSRPSFSIVVRNLICNKEKVLAKVSRTKHDAVIKKARALPEPFNY
jgi:hypothetical protein